MKTIPYFRHEIGKYRNPISVLTNNIDISNFFRVKLWQVIVMNTTPALKVKNLLFECSKRSEIGNI